jgi:hypothetical protein
MGQFRRFLNSACLKEIHLRGYLFTWSNEHMHPMLEGIDRAFISREWDELYPHHDLHPPPPQLYVHTMPPALAYRQRG